MRRPTRDPYWLAAKFASKCGCGKDIKPGDRIMYFPNQKSAECEACGLKSDALMADERSFQ